MSQTMNEAAAASGSGSLLRDVMIDIETLGTAPGCSILSIGAAMFGPDGVGEAFYTPVLLSSCTKAGLFIDSATVAWWMQQSDAARAEAFRADAAPLPGVLNSFSAWFLQHGAERPWSHGATFDIPVMEAAYKACNMAPPWEFWNVRDTRTLYDLAAVKVDRSKGTRHNALDDAINQARAASRAMRILRARTELAAA